MDSPLNIRQQPISVQQFRLGGQQGATGPSRGMGTFTLNINAAGTAAESAARMIDFLPSQRPVVYTAVHNVVTEITVQLFPTTSPIVAIVCSEEAEPRIENDLVFLCFAGYDTVPLGATGGLETAELEIGSKFSGTRNVFGPFKVPGNHRNFRGYFYQPGVPTATVNNNGNILGLYTTTIGGNHNFFRSFCLLNVYGY